MKRSGMLLVPLGSQILSSSTAYRADGVYSKFGISNSAPRESREKVSTWNPLICSQMPYPLGHRAATTDS